MITLIIKEKGHLIEIPGMPSFRTPATVDISKGDIRTIVGYLKVCAIQDYEIIASNDSGSEVYSARDFNTTQTKVVEKIKKPHKKDKALEKRMDKLEKLIQGLYEKSDGDSDKNGEQTTKQMEQFQNNVLDALKKISVGGQNVTETEREGKHNIIDEEEPEPFIPDIDTEGMKLKSQGDHKTVKKDEGSDDAADALSKLLK